MRKKIILRLILFSVLAFSIYSCMHDDLSNPLPEQQASASSFNVFRKDSTGKDPDYATGFAVLYWKYQNLHPDFKQSIARNINDGKPAVFFRLASEVLVLDDGSKAVIYPVVTDDHITGLAAGVLNQEENYVSYQMVSETTENYDNIISAFRIRFSLLPKNNTMKPGGNGSGCNDVSGCGETQIEPIVIRPKPRSIQWGGSGDNDPWGNDPDNPPGGECGGFGDCGGGGGNNNPSNPETPQDPCEKIVTNNSSAKSILAKTKISARKAELTSSVGTDTKEKSFLFGVKPDGSYEAGSVQQGTTYASPMEATHPDFKVNGGAHTHTADVYDITSPGDIYIFVKNNTTNPDFKYLYTFANNNVGYVLTITNPTRFANFNTNYPTSINFDPETQNWNRTCEVGKDFFSSYNYFKDSGAGSDEALELAMAFVISKYDMGVGLSKMDEKGNFKPLFVKEKPNPSDPTKKIYEKTEDCNFK